MSEYLIGAANIGLGVLLHALITGRMSRNAEGREYWSAWRAKHPAFSGYGPAFLVAFGLFRIGLGVVG